MSAVENSIRGKQHEELYIYDKDGKLIAGAKGGRSSVCIPNGVNLDGATLTHNHPTGISDYGATLSFADVHALTSSNAKAIRAVSKGQGEFNYIMKKAKMRIRAVSQKESLKTCLK